MRALLPSQGHFEVKKIMRNNVLQSQTKHFFLNNQTLDINAAYIHINLIGIWIIDDLAVSRLVLKARGGLR